MASRKRPAAPTANAAQHLPDRREGGERRALPPFEEAIEPHRADIWRFAVAQTDKDRAEDLFQETMLAALAAYPQLRDPDVMRSWLFRIAARKAVDLFREQARNAIAVAEPDMQSVPERPLPDEEMWGQVRMLPDKQRHAVTLRYVLDLKYAEIAATMQTSPEAARRNVFEGLRALRTRLAAGRQDAAAADGPPSLTATHTGGSR